MDSRLVFFDLETGGLNPNRHPIIQLAAIAVNEVLQPLEAFEAKVRFDPRRANRHSLRKNHYSPGLWAQDSVPAENAAKRFAGFLRRHASVPVVAADGTTYRITQLVAHNAAFDGPFLQAWYERLRVYLPAQRHVLCTMQRAMWFFDEAPGAPRAKDLKLATICQHFRVPFHAADVHEALADVSATLALYRALRLWNCQDGYRAAQAVDVV
jgi:DNA polymerase III alpha subunit (gram-positive type)